MMIKNIASTIMLALFVSFFSCILTGLFTSMLWPGTLIMMEENIPHVGVSAYALMAAGGDMVAVITVATLGNWIGGLTSYWVGRAGRWEWIERLHVKRESLERQRSRIERYGAAVALLTWVPFVGDVFAVALGFYRVRFVPMAFWMLLGKCGRFVTWYLIYLLF